jgi:GTP cyclohydrolase II
MSIISKKGGVMVIFSALGNNKKSTQHDNILRNYGIGAQILNDIGVKNMILLTKSPKSVIGLEGYGLKITDYKSFD